MSDFSLTYEGDPFTYTPYNDNCDDISHNENLVYADHTISGGSLSKTQFTDLFAANQTANKTEWLSGLKIILENKIGIDSVGQKLLRLTSLNAQKEYEFISYTVDLTKFNQSLVALQINNIADRWVSGKKLQLIFSFQPAGTTQTFKIGVIYNFS
jgi:hypothetical protein